MIRLLKQKVTTDSNTNPFDAHYYLSFTFVALMVVGKCCVMLRDPGTGLIQYSNITIVELNNMARQK